MKPLLSSKIIMLLAAIFLLTGCQPTAGPISTASPSPTREPSRLAASATPVPTFTPASPRTAVTLQSTAAASPLAPGEYYVSPEGNDANDGSKDRPWQTLQKAADTLQAGDTLYVRGGLYQEHVTFAHSGTQEKPIHIHAYAGEAPVIDGGSELPKTYTGLLSLTGDWIEISGLEVSSSKYTGITLFGKHDTADNVYAHHNHKSGIQIGGDYGTVENSRAWRNSLDNENGVSKTWSTGLTASRDITDGLTEHAVIRHNIVWENWGQGISTYESNGTVIEDNITHDNFATNIYLSDTTNALCQRNLVYMSPDSYVFGHGPNVGILIGDEKYKPRSANLTVINNIVFGNQRNLFWFEGTQPGGLNNALIANNTFANSVGIDGIQINQGQHQNARFVNNIIVQDGKLPIALVQANPELHFANNLWSQEPPAAARGEDDITGDPLLAKTGQPLDPEWFRPGGSSPALGKALALPEVLVDFFDESRDSPPDIGAVEHKQP